MSIASPNLLYTPLDLYREEKVGAPRDMIL